MQKRFIMNPYIYIWTGSVQLSPSIPSVAFACHTHHSRAAIATPTVDFALTAETEKSRDPQGSQNWPGGPQGYNR